MWPGEGPEHAPDERRVALTSTQVKWSEIETNSKPDASASRPISTSRRAGCSSLTGSCRTGSSRPWRRRTRRHALPDRTPRERPRTGDPRRSSPPRNVAMMGVGAVGRRGPAAPVVGMGGRVGSPGRSGPRPDGTSARPRRRSSRRCRRCRPSARSPTPPPTAARQLATAVAVSEQEDSLGGVRARSCRSSRPRCGRANPTPGVGGADRRLDHVGDPHRARRGHSPPDEVPPRSPATPTPCGLQDEPREGAWRLPRDPDGDRRLADMGDLVANVVTGARFDSQPGVGRARGVVGIVVTPR